MALLDMHRLDWRDAVEKTGHALTPLEMGAVAPFAVILSYFQLAAPTGLPHCRDVKPAKFKPYLAHLFLWDLVFGRDGILTDLYFRLMGEEVATFHGETPHGRASDIANPDGRSQLLALGGQAVTDGQPFAWRSQVDLPGVGLMEVSTLYVPLAGDSGRVKRLLGCSLIDGLVLNTHRPPISKVIF